ncbi:Slc45 like protein [Elysia marginata]|uniref:Slc45 like protein n=1 Tax=Elysia marginata TaxID=1093978 RepID=A0AAV4H5Z0_9GAST|nr:Slc45 like protein [Elysia marginata]
MFAMAGSLVVFVTGLVLLITSSFVKIRELKTVLGVLHGHMYNHTVGVLNDTQSINSAYKIANNRTVSHMEQTHTDESDSEELGEEDSGVTAIIVMSILGFTCIDMGFDLTIALSRASILDVVPKFQHKQVLVLATIVQSVAGFICAAIGCLDLPGILGSIFNIDGTAATLVFFCCVLMTTSFISFSLMGFANYRLSRRKDNLSISTSSSYDTDSSTNNRRQSVVQAAFEQLEEKGSLYRLKELQDNQVFASSTLPTGSADVYKRPLLLHSLKTNYLTINKDGSSGIRCESDSYQQEAVINNLEVNSLEGMKSPGIKEHGSASGANADNTESFLSCPSIVKEHEGQENDEVSTVLEVINQPYSVSMTTLEALNVLEIGQIREDEDTTPKNKTDSAESREERYKKMKKKLLILCISCFFTIGAAISYSMYAFNAFNLGIMHGDPSALPGSEGRQNYESGLRLGSFGNMVFYSAFLLISLSNARVIRMIGETGQFILNHVILIACLVAVITYKRMDVFMVFLGCCGLFRPCMLTLPFVMAHQIAQEGMSTQDEESGQKKSYSGRVMTLIGLLVPAHFCILSIMMGPLMEATGSCWVPLFYCLGSSSVSLGVSSLLFFV